MCLMCLTSKQKLKSQNKYSLYTATCLSVDCVWNVMAHSQKPDFVFRRNGRVHLNRRRPSVQLTTGNRGVRISGSNAGYTMFRGGVKGTDYPLHSPVSPSLPLLCVTVGKSHFNWTLLALGAMCGFDLPSHTVKERSDMDKRKIRPTSLSRMRDDISYTSEAEGCKSNIIKFEIMHNFYWNFRLFQGQKLLKSQRCSTAAGPRI